MKVILPAALILGGCLAAQAAVVENEESHDSACEGAVVWPLWSRYVSAFVTADGRVKEPSAGNRTTSEGQSYALFFALVANDRPLFDRLLRWTEANLAGGDLGKHLPGWHWGEVTREESDKKPKGKRLGDWTLLDRASASDADLWIAYTLLEAGRLWKDGVLVKQGRAILANVLKQEVVDLPGFGPMLLPGPVGFEFKEKKSWRLNPSYLLIQHARRFAAAGVPGPWGDLPATIVHLIRETSPTGFAADWVSYSAVEGLGVDKVSGPIGSYDAIRVYLWAGMLPPDEPLRAPLVAALAGPLHHLANRGTVPEKVNVSTGEDRGAHAPPGFLAVHLPEARFRGDEALYANLLGRLALSWKDGLYGSPPFYYDQNLVLFARGFSEGRYHFDRNGFLRPSWKYECDEP